MGKARSARRRSPSSHRHQLAIDQANNYIIVGNENYLYKFNFSGTPVAFSAIAPNTELGPVSLNYCCSDIAVDNSGGAGGVGEGEQGRIYAMSEEESKVVGWKANGEPVSGGFAPPNGLSVTAPCGMDVDSDGNVWVGSSQSEDLIEFNPQGVKIGRSRHRQGRLFAGDRRERELLHKRVPRTGDVQIQPDRHATRSARAG